MPSPGPDKISYAERLLQKILTSELLVSKLLDKLLPDPVPERVSYIELGPLHRQ